VPLLLVLAGISGAWTGSLTARAVPVVFPRGGRRFRRPGFLACLFPAEIRVRRRQLRQPAIFLDYENGTLDRDRSDCDQRHRGLVGATLLLNASEGESGMKQAILISLSFVSSVSVGLTAKIATVAFDPSRSNLAQIAAASTSAGYPAKPATDATK
jgi:copper chaperone CopZ